MTPQRIDKWLYFARVVKSRSLAVKIVTLGKVRVNRQKIIKPATEINAGDILTIALPGGVRVLKVCDAALRRGSASQARLLYEDRNSAQNHVLNH